MRDFIIDDTTLRDGEQTPGVSFTAKEKLHIAKMLDETGVQEIEAGIPVMGRCEADVFSKIVGLGLNARIIAWNRALISDIKASINAGADSVEISLPLSDMQIASKLGKTRGWVLEQVRRVTDFCVDKNLYVSVGGEDASRADMEFLKEYIAVIQDAGAKRFRFCDTVGVLDPFSTYEKIKELADFADIDIEMHAHNDFGMATANAVAALKAGASHINTTVIGLGERAGNTPLEELIMSAKHVLNMNTEFCTHNLKPLAEYVSRAAGRRIEPYRPVIGDFMFTHESGIHTDGVLKNPANYEAFAPEELGMHRNLVVGAHSGTGIIGYKLKNLGICCDAHTLKLVLKEAKREASRKKKALRDEELVSIYQKISAVNISA